ncbi:hypothetical protein SELSPUOL_00761 [Selenomonas sputigena ATCC 35185]|uniref:Uncharacterized protein n=1 Tax=Selenomonas sputigena (strain ATCC 35185 / DSM 20758 / CCUG 44933 / VPI D19B-28) TaxID=546271 RepID=C9LTH8_SELS3|nr:hypothetical protein SELSPUOL_00761 [Selenomonas sputigena ATCC 35185]
MRKTCSSPLVFKVFAKIHSVRFRFTMKVQEVKPEGRRLIG